jgi:hypothetical protein
MFTSFFNTTPINEKLKEETQRYDDRDYSCFKFILVLSSVRRCPGYFLPLTRELTLKLLTLNWNFNIKLSCPQM